MLFPRVTLSQHLSLARLAARVSCFVYCICVQSLSLSLTHTHSLSFSCSRSSHLAPLISPSSIPVFIYLFISLPSSLHLSSCAPVVLWSLGNFTYHWLRPIALGKERSDDLQLYTFTQFHDQVLLLHFEMLLLAWPSVLKGSAFQKKYRWPC